MKLQSTNPSISELLGEVDISTESDITAAIEKAHQAFPAWKQLSIEQRADKLRTLFELIHQNRVKLGELITQEMGMPYKERDAIEIGSGLEYFEWYLRNTFQYLKPEMSFEDDQMVNKVMHEPYGVAAVIQPWNFPFSQWVWGVIPALIAGNTVVFKPSEEVPLSNQFIESLVKESELPEGVLNFVYGDGKVGDYLVHQHINLIVFTGSTKTGRHLFQVAAEKLVKINLEMGGSAPGIVLKDADIDTVVSIVLMNRFGNCGQICDGLKRLIIHEDRYEEVVNRLVAELKSKKIGNPSQEDTDFGPLVSQKQLEILQSQVHDALNKGAQILCGGKQPENLKGWYYEPTILTNITSDMQIWNEEVFGPVLPIVTYETEEDAIKLANDTEYGLGGYIFSNDTDHAEKIAYQLDSGMIAINDSYYLHPSSPFGGYKHSGIGREHGKYGLDDVTQIKVISIPK